MCWWLLSRWQDAHHQACRTWKPGHQCCQILQDIILRWACMASGDQEYKFILEDFLPRDRLGRKNTEEQLVSATRTSAHSCESCYQRSSKEDLSCGSPPSWFHSSGDPVTFGFSVPHGYCFPLGLAHLVIYPICRFQKDIRVW